MNRSTCVRAAALFCLSVSGLWAQLKPTSIATTTAIPQPVDGNHRLTHAAVVPAPTVTSAATVPTSCTAGSLTFITSGVYAGTWWACRTTGTATTGTPQFLGPYMPGIPQTIPPSAFPSYLLPTGAPYGVVLLDGTGHIPQQYLSPAAQPLPVVSLSPATGLTFGSFMDGQTSPAQKITLTNTGPAFLALSGTSVTGANATDFVQSNTCGRIVPSGASCTFSVQFVPTATGPESASLTLTTNANPATVAIPLTGVGTALITSGGITISPSQSSAKPGDVVTLTANKPVNWSLTQNSIGTLKIVSPTQATYTPPATIPAQNARGGCLVMPNDSIFNTPIDKLPLNASNASWTDTATPTVDPLPLQFAPSWGLALADATTPTRSMAFYYTTANNGPFPVPTPPNGRQLGSMNAYAQNDHHRIVLRPDLCRVYETYNDAPDGTMYGCATKTCNGQSGVSYASTSYTLLGTNGSTDAAGLPLYELTLHADELRALSIHHALRFTMPPGFIRASPYWPAMSHNGGVSNALMPPYGARWRLKASFDQSKFSPGAQAILTALKTYGIVLADAGSGYPAVSLDDDVQKDPSLMSYIGEVQQKITLAQMEAVDESSLMISGTSYAVNPLNQYQQTIGGAVIVATDATNATYQATFDLPLTPVLVGVPNATENVVAGAYSFPLKAWVNGTTNQAVTWKLLNPVGSITAAGVYTPPASVSAMTNVLAVATSAANPAATATVKLMIFPASADKAFRVDVGSPSATKDGNGQTWNPDIGMDTDLYVQKPGDYPNWAALAGNPLQVQYQSQGYSYGGDLRYTWHIPNGTYKIHLLFGSGYYGCSPCGQTNPGWASNINILVNGALLAKDFDYGAQINYQYGVPTDLNLSATVTNNLLDLVLMVDNPMHGSTLNPGPHLNGIEVIPQ